MCAVRDEAVLANALKLVRTRVTPQQLPCHPLCQPTKALVASQRPHFQD